MASSYLTLAAVSDRHPNIVNADPLDGLDLAEATRAAFPGDAGRRPAPPVGPMYRRRVRWARD
jgi:hypothetical protein